MHINQINFCMTKFKITFELEIIELPMQYFKMFFLIKYYKKLI